MKKKRLLALVLALLMMGGTLVSCANSNPEDTLTTTDIGTETEAELSDNLPDDLDFEEREIVFISSHASDVADEINATAITGDPVNDAVFERNKTVEKRLNIKITSVHAGDPTAQVINSISSGSDDYDVMVARAWKAAPKTIDGYFANLRNTPYIDFDKPWWTQSFNEVMEYEGMQFAVTGAIVLSTYRRTHTTTFNKKIFTDANQPFLYEYVENGTWTLGKQASLVPLLHKDNGNSIQDWTGDVYGFVSRRSV